VPVRLQIAADAEFKQVLSDQRLEPGAEVRIAHLQDAQWHLRARRIDAQGIEGFDATQSFILKATPQPPAYRTPRTGAKQAVGGIEFAWASNAQATTSRLQVAQDAAFTKIVQDEVVAKGDTLQATLPEPGSYFWRLASVRASGDQGPFGDAQPFELRPTPSTPEVKTSAEGLRFSWGGRSVDKQQVQLASDAAFTQIVAQDELAALEWALPQPQFGGRHYFRYRSVEPDGFVTPYSETLTIDVPRDKSGLLLLLPFLLLL
jgi:hypothetical protein